MSSIAIPQQIKQYAPIALWGLCAISFISAIDPGAGLTDKSGRVAASGAFGYAAFRISRSTTNNLSSNAFTESILDIENTTKPIAAPPEQVSSSCLWVPSGEATPDDDRLFELIKQGREQTPQRTRNELIETVLGGVVEGQFSDRWSDEFDRLIFVCGQEWIAGLLESGMTIDEVIDFVWGDQDNPNRNRYHCKISEIVINKKLR